MSKKLAISIRSRLLNLAKSKRENFDYVLRQYLMQRLLLVELEALLLPIYRGLAEGADFAKHWSFDPNPIGPSEFLGLWKDRDISQADLREKAWK